MPLSTFPALMRVTVMTEPVCSVGSGRTGAVAIMAQPNRTTPNERGCFMSADTHPVAGQGL